MLSKSSCLLLIQALPSVLAVDVDTWGAYFWSGSHCTSEETGAFTGPNRPHKGKVCHAIPDIGVTQAVDFYANGDRYTFGIHQRDDCSDDGGFYKANPDIPSCIETSNVGGAIAFSVKTGTKSRRDIELVEADLTNATALELERRALDSFHLTGIIGAGGFAITAAQSCPQVVYPTNNPAPHKGQAVSSITTCAISASFAVVVSFITGFHSSGEEEKQNGGKRALGIDDSPIVRVYDGFTAAISTIDPVTDDFGDVWEQKIYHMTDNETGEAYTTNYQHHPATDRHIMSADVASDDTQNELVERQSASTFRAYYAWTNENKSVFKKRSTSKSEKQQLAASVWNYGRKNDQDVYCANFAVRGNDANKGQFAITNGVFSPDFSSC